MDAKLDQQIGRRAAVRELAVGADTAAVESWPRALLLFCLGAVLVRTLTTVFLPSVVWPDETFQSTEQALRLLTGQGMVPWEYQIGARSWLLPGLIAPVVAVGRALSSDPRLTFALIAALMIALSAVNVVSAYVISAKAGGRLAGLLAAGLAAFWSELVYFSPHLLADTVSGALLLAGVAVVSGPKNRRRLFWAGVLLGATLVVRVQLAPAIGLVALLTCGKDFGRRVVPFAVGFALPVAMLGAVDWLTWGAPFRSVFIYLTTNTSGLADYFGVWDPLSYVGTEKRIWGAATPLILATAVLGARKAPVPVLAALLILLTFSLVPHKEHRFIYPALLLLFVGCGVGTVELANDVGRLVRGPRARAAVSLALAALWGAAALASGLGPAMRPHWLRDADVLRAFDVVNADAASCGLGLDYPSWTRSGQSRLRTDVLLYDGARTQADAFNYLLRLPGPKQSLATYTTQGFSLQRCFGSEGVCLLKRPGRCTPGRPPLRAVTPPEVRTILAKQGFAVY